MEQGGGQVSGGVSVGGVGVVPSITIVLLVLLQKLKG